ncbi:MAG: SET domain-containing protein-lysine N-methyltransferase [Geitlerinemataceae cyanobacterium]
MIDIFELREIEGKGEGIFATQKIKASDTVMVGKFDKILDANHSHASQIGKETYALHAGLISKVNHCCAPNCGIKVNETGAHDFVAMKDISVDEEITFDYAMRNYSVDHFPPKCMCGSKLCRGRVTGWKDLPETRKQDYKGFVAPYLLEIDMKK